MTNRRAWTGIATAAFAGLLLAAPAARAEEGDRPARLVAADPGVVLQRSTEQGTEEAFPNMPFLPGDRIWTQPGARASLQLLDGTLVRIDGRSKLGYVADSGERAVLRLWSGSLYVQTEWARTRPALEIETPGGVVTASERALFRIDIRQGEVRLSVLQGEARVEAGREIEVRAGERVYVRPGEEPGRPRGFDVAQADEFDQWNEDQDRGGQWADQGPEGLPEEVSPYAGELGSHGSWDTVSEVGIVWRPQVAAGWQPYSHGRWVWTAYGWTWVPGEPWGWATAHYGRWDYGPGMGWYWIPDATWGPAWVSWAVGDEYVGWCPLGRGNRPVAYEGRVAGHAVPRGSAWAYTSRAELGSNRPMQALSDERLAARVRVVDQPMAGPTRDLGSMHPVKAVRRAGSSHPTIGDYDPALRGDGGRTTIPAPVYPSKGTASPRHDDGTYQSTPVGRAGLDQHPLGSGSGASAEGDGTKSAPRPVQRDGSGWDAGQGQRPISRENDARTAPPPTAKGAPVKSAPAAVERAEPAKSAPRVGSGSDSGSARPVGSGSEGSAKAVPRSAPRSDSSAKGSSSSKGAQPIGGSGSKADDQKKPVSSLEGAGDGSWERESPSSWRGQGTVLLASWDDTKPRESDRDALRRLFRSTDKRASDPGRKRGSDPKARPSPAPPPTKGGDKSKGRTQDDDPPV